MDDTAVAKIVESIATSPVVSINAMRIGPRSDLNPTSLRLTVLLTRRSFLLHGADATQEANARAGPRIPEDPIYLRCQATRTRVYEFALTTTLVSSVQLVRAQDSGRRDIHSDNRVQCAPNVLGQLNSKPHRLYVHVMMGDDVR